MNNVNNPDVWVLFTYSRRLPERKPLLSSQIPRKTIRNALKTAPLKEFCDCLKRRLHNTLIDVVYVFLLCRRINEWSVKHCDSHLRTQSVKLIPMNGKHLNATKLSISLSRETAPTIWSHSLYIRFETFREKISLQRWRHCRIVVSEIRSEMSVKVNKNRRLCKAKRCEMKSVDVGDNGLEMLFVQILRRQWLSRIIS